MCSSSSRMILSLIFLLPVGILAENKVSQDECMVMSNCSDQGPEIRFPFKLKGQPDHCGYPGFEFSCTEKKQTVIDLPYSVKLLVKKINYTTQEIRVQDPDNCPPRQLQNLNLAASLFQFKLGNPWDSSDDFDFVNCSLNKSPYQYRLSFISCLSVPGNLVYAIPSEADLGDLDLSSCRKMYNISLPNPMPALNDTFSMSWSKSICGKCEAEGQMCRLKSNSMEPLTKCIQKPNRGTMFICILLFHFLNKHISLLLQQTKY